MALYESYLDEDISDESFADSADFDEDYDDSAEDFDDSGDFEEGKKRGRNRRSYDRRRGYDPSWRARHRHNRNRQTTTAPVTGRNIQKAFNNVGIDFNSLNNKLKSTQSSQATLVGVDILSAALLKPTLAEDPKDSTKLVIKDNLLPFILVKVVGNQLGSNAKVDFKKIVPWVLAAFLISPDSFKQLGLPTSDNKNAAGNGDHKLFGDLDTTTALLVGGLAYLSFKK